TGVYNYTNNFQCTAPLDGSQPPDLIAQAAANNQGANVGCTFIGRVMQFGPSSDRTAFNTFSVVGRQYTGSPLSSAEVQNLAQAHPMPISPTLAAPARPNATESGQLGYGLQLQSITYDNGSGPQPIGAFGFFTNFTSYSITGSLQSSKQFTDLWAVVPSSLDKTQEDTAQAIIDMDTSAASKNPQNGITLCFVSASSSQYGKIVVGDDQNRLSTQLTIGEGSVCL
ncbi:MAG TPA: hypothetical protein VLE74_00220, partial [Candidatus Saccharimonadales bacterium]|nr:hypothetical protein [Candidatus Saccharimonadales bacterium]